MAILFICTQKYVQEKIIYALGSSIEIVAKDTIDECDDSDLAQYDYILIDKSTHILKQLNNVPYIVCSFSNKVDNELCYSDKIDKWLQKLKINNKQPLKHTKPEKQTVSFVGVRGNVGTTTIAWECANYLKQFGKVFYLNVSPFQNIGDVSIEDTQNFSDMLIAIKTGHSVDLNQAIIQWQGIMTFLPSQDRLDYTSVTGNDIKALIQLIYEQLDCEYVVVDIVFNELIIKKDWISCCHKWFFVDSKVQLDIVRTVVNHFERSEQVKFSKLYYMLNKKGHADENYDIFIPKFTINVSQELTQYLQKIWQVYM